MRRTNGKLTAAERARNSNRSSARFVLSSFSLRRLSVEIPFFLSAEARGGRFEVEKAESLVKIRSRYLGIREAAPVR